MKKRSHVILTDHIARSLFPSHSLPLLFGSILPDFLLHTFIRRHSWDKTHKMIFRKMRTLSSFGLDCAASSLKLGYILHYIEDYFTYPHNSNFEDSLDEHVRYENAQVFWLKQRLEADSLSGGKPSAAVSERGDLKAGNIGIDHICRALEHMHEEYMANEQGFENDHDYMTKAVSMVSEYFSMVFEANTQKFLLFPEFPFKDFSDAVMEILYSYCLCPAAKLQY